MTTEHKPEERPESHQAIADKYSMRMDDPLTRMAIAALYWRECAEYWKRQATLP